MITAIYTIFILYEALLLLYLYFWLRQAEVKISDERIDDQPLTFFSVVIPARNEEKNIGACIDSILAQNYPTDRFEILVVDDHSEDNTASIVRSYNQPIIKVISLQDVIEDSAVRAYKKKAIDAAIKEANGEWIITTDADCIVPDSWFQSFHSVIHDRKKNPVFIAGPVKYFHSNRFLSIFQSLDFATLQGVTAGSIYAGAPTMCNGANLAYSKSAFFEVGGFTGIDQVSSGDDVLLMQKMHKKYPGRIMYLKNRAAIVQTHPMPSLEDFINQRIRWASKAGNYDGILIYLVMGTVYLVNLLILLLGIAGFFNSIYWEYGLGVLIGKTVIEMIFITPVIVFFNQVKLLIWFPLAQPFHIVYTVVVGFLGKFGTFNWKGRKF
ncbi:MAG TPA: glycosyltransferase [Parasegetibacter sp.]